MKNDNDNIKKKTKTKQKQNKNKTKKTQSHRPSNTVQHYLLRGCQPRNCEKILHAVTF